MKSAILFLLVMSATLLSCSNSKSKKAKSFLDFGVDAPLSVYCYVDANLPPSTKDSICVLPFSLVADLTLSIRGDLIDSVYLEKVYYFDNQLTLIGYSDELPGLLPVVNKLGKNELGELRDLEDGDYGIHLDFTRFCGPKWKFRPN